MKSINRSSNLHGICYDIRGPVLDEAKRFEEILKLNIGNPAPFGFDASDDVYLGNLGINTLMINSLAV